MWWVSKRSSMKSGPTSGTSSQATSWLWSIYPRNLAEVLVLFLGRISCQIGAASCQVKARIWSQCGQRAVLLFPDSKGLLEGKDGRHFGRYAYGAGGENQWTWYHTLVSYSALCRFANCIARFDTKFSQDSSFCRKCRQNFLLPDDHPLLQKTCKAQIYYSYTVLRGTTMSPGFWEGSDGLPNWCEVGGPGLRWQSTNPLTCNQCRPKANEPKWRHIHWDYMKEHQAKTKISKLESTLQLPDVSGEEKPCEKRAWIKLEAMHEDASSCTGTCCVKSAQCVLRFFGFVYVRQQACWQLWSPHGFWQTLARTSSDCPCWRARIRLSCVSRQGLVIEQCFLKKICHCCCIWGREENIGIEGKVGPF